MSSNQALNPSSGYVRMFQTLRSQSGADIKIFSTVEDAHVGSGW